MPKIATADRVDRGALLDFLRPRHRAVLLDLPGALEPLGEYYRAISGEHPDWEQYRAAMARQGKALLRISVTRWGPIATGGLPADVADKPRALLRARKGDRLA